MSSIGTRLAPDVCYIELDGYGELCVVLSFEQGPEFPPCYIERLGKYTSFCGDRHKICIPDPAGQNVEVEVVGDAGTRGFAQVESHVQAARVVNLPQHEFGALGQEHQLIGGLGRDRSQRGEMLVGHDHDMASGVRIGVEAHKTVHAAMDDVDGLFGGVARHAVSDGVVDGRDHIAKDAVLVVGPRWRPGIQRGGNAGAGLRVGAGDVAVAPRGPEAIHWPSIAGRVQRLAVIAD